MVYSGEATVRRSQSERCRKRRVSVSEAFNSVRPRTLPLILTECAPLESLSRCRQSG